MPLEEGIALMKKGFHEINTRFLVGGATFTLKVHPSRDYLADISGPGVLAADAVVPVSVFWSKALS